MAKKVVLCILDGFGIGEKKKNNAIFMANTPNLDFLLENFPNSQLQASGSFVGLPDGQMGNSEVGHMTIGGGRKIENLLVTINRSIKNGTMESVEGVEMMSKSDSKNVHLIGLCSKGGVHSDAQHIVALAKIFSKAKKNVLLHLISDGRDCGFDSFADYIDNFYDEIATMDNVKIATICGRYYAMDRDKNYSRTQLFGDLILLGEGKKIGSKKPLSKDEIVNSILEFYRKEVYDEMITPTVWNGFEGIKQLDDVFFVNFRSDRFRQIAELFVKSRLACLIENIDKTMNLDNRKEVDAFPSVSSNAGQNKVEMMVGFPIESMLMLDGLEEKFMNECGKVVFMSDYFSNKDNPINKFTTIAFKKPSIKSSLGEVVANNGLSQIRIAETEKYAHVTYFFNGGVDIVFPKEERILIPSAKVKTHDLFPQMAAKEICNAVIDSTKKGYDLIVANFANCDMVGHTGNFPATVESVEFLDKCLGSLARAGLEGGYDVIITSDHGNADEMILENGKKNTKHSMNAVYFILVSEERVGNALKNGDLADVAPTILNIMGIEKPKEMEGKSLIVELERGS